MELTNEEIIETLEEIDNEVWNEDCDGYTYHIAIKKAIEIIKSVSGENKQ